MMALAAIATSLLAAQDVVAVAVVSRWPGTESVSVKLAEELKGALTRAELPALSDAETRERAKAAKLPDPRNCKGVRACLLRLAVGLGERAVVIGIDVGKLSDRLVVRLEVVRADSSEPLDTLEINTTARGWSDDSVVPLAQFARHLKELLHRAEPEPAAKPVAVTAAPAAEPAPAAVVTAPVAAPAPAVETVQPAPARGRTLAFATGGVGLGSLVASGVVMALAFNARAGIQSTYSTDAMGIVMSSLRRAELDARASGVNTQFIVSGIVGAVGAALVATAIALLLAS